MGHGLERDGIGISVAIAIRVTTAIAILAVRGTRDKGQGTRDFVGVHSTVDASTERASAAFSTRAHDRPGRVGPGGVENLTTRPDESREKGLWSGFGTVESESV